MSIDGNSLGKDVRVVINTATGILNIPPSAITKFDAQPETGDEKRIGLDGVVRHNLTHEGWKGSFEIDRRDNTLDDWWATAEAAYYAGQSLPPGTIQETISEPNGAVSQYRFEGVVIKLDDMGSREGNKIIKMKVSFMASRRLKA